MNNKRERDRSSERDQLLDRLLRQSFRTDSAAVAPGSCLDAETLAAWVDGGLAGTDLVRTEAHVAACSRCQGTAAALVKHPPATPALEARWPRSWGLGWLIPLTAGAAAVALWFALPTNQGPGVSEPTQVQTQAAGAPTPQEPRLTTPPQQSAPAAREQVAAGTGQRALEQDLDKEAKLKAANTARREDQQREARQAPADQVRAAADALGKLRDEKPAAPPVAASAPAAPPAAASPATAPVTVARADESAAPAAALRSALSRQAADTAATEIVSSNPSVRWRIGAAGSIQYSTNGGSTWEALPTAIVVDLTAGASPSPSVCWVVGRAGTVLLTTDGRRWQRLAFPETVDLVAVQATDARAATVTTADGRQLRTLDGGATWN